MQSYPSFANKSESSLGKQICKDFKLTTNYNKIKEHR